MPPESPTHDQQTFWQELVQLKADACYVRECRDELNKWVTGTAALRAVTSTGSIAGWLIWKQYALAWAILIAAAQLADALRDVFPFARRRAALGRLCRSLNRLVVEAERDWDDIASGICTGKQIRKLTHHLRSRKERAGARFAPNGLPNNPSLMAKAQAEAGSFALKRYNTDKVEETPLYADETDRPSKDSSY